MRFIRTAGPTKHTTSSRSHDGKDSYDMVSEAPSISCSMTCCSMILRLQGDQRESVCRLEGAGPGAGLGVVVQLLIPLGLPWTTRAVLSQQLLLSLAPSPKAFDGDCPAWRGLSRGTAHPCLRWTSPPLGKQRAACLPPCGCQSLWPRAGLGAGRAAGSQFGFLSSAARFLQMLILPKRKGA